MSQASFPRAVAASLSTALAALLLVFPVAAQNPAAPSLLETGTVAPPIGELGWAQLGEGAKVAPDLAALRGDVVIVATYGYYCDSCVRVGVPVLNALRKANAKDELAIVALTALIGEDTTETVTKEARRLGIDTPVGMADVEGVASPYLDMSANSNLTYAFVIGRTGGIVWRGDPSRKRDEYVAAVTSALAAVPAQPLPIEWMREPVAPELAPALRDYVSGDFQKALSQLRKLLKALGLMKVANPESVRAQANQLLALVQGTHKTLMDELELSASAKDAEKFQRYLGWVRRGFPKGEGADRASQLELEMTKPAQQGLLCKEWLEWYELEARRPATFPADRDQTAQKYARDLVRYAKQAGAPGLERVRAWLSAYERLK